MGAAQALTACPARWRKRGGLSQLALATAAGPVLLMRFEKGGTTLRLFTVTATLGTLQGPTAVAGDPLAER